MDAICARVSDRCVSVGGGQSRTRDDDSGNAEHADAAGDVRNAGADAEVVHAERGPELIEPVQHETRILQRVGGDAGCERELPDRARRNGRGRKRRVLVLLGAEWRELPERGEHANTGDKFVPLGVHIAEWAVRSHNAFLPERLDALGFDLLADDL